MSKFTIEQLEALKEGTTPGPWGVDNSDPDWPILTGPLVLEGNLVSQEILADLGGELSDPNFHMILATPAVIDQLIATEMKLQKVFKSIESLRTECLDVVFREGSGHEEYTGNEAAELIEEAHYKALTRILEGDNG